MMEHETDLIDWSTPRASRASIALLCLLAAAAIAGGAWLWPHISN